MRRGGFILQTRVTVIVPQSRCRTIPAARWKAFIEWILMAESPASSRMKLTVPTESRSRQTIDFCLSPTTITTIVGGARKLWRFNLKPNGSIDAATQTLIYDWGSTRGPDGLKLDTTGRLYVAAGRNRAKLPCETADPPTAGIYVFSPVGELLEFVAIPRDETTNCAFGGVDGKTLFITAGGTLWSIRTTAPGQVF